MRILFVLENYYPNVGGVETLFKNHLEQLASKGHQIQLITTKLFEDSPKLEKHNNLTIFRYNFINRYFFTLFAFIPVFLKAKNADIIHTTSYNAALPALLGGLLRRKKIVITFHEVWSKLWFSIPYTPKYMQNIYYYFEQFLLKLPFTKFIGVSNATVQNLIKSGVDKNKACLIYNGIDYDEINKFKLDIQKDKTYHFYFFGRLGISKGIDLILKAAKILKDELKDCKFNFITPNHPKYFYDIVQNYIKKNQLQENIVLHKNKSKKELFEALQKANCVLIPSYSEGFCFAAVECIALNIPIISSDQTALKEVVSGKYIKMKELSVEALVEACRLAYQNKFDESPFKIVRIYYLIHSWRKMR